MKKIVSISGHMFELFRFLLPRRLMLPHQMVLGCIDDNTPLGCAVIDIYGSHRSLSWLYVPQQQRSQGTGSLLLDAACRHALKEPGAEMELTYPGDEPWADTLDSISAQRGGQLRFQDLPSFQISGDELKRSPLMRGVDPRARNASNIIPFNALTRAQLRALLLQCEQSGMFSVSRANFDQADPLRSMVILDQQLPVGLTLIRDVDGEGNLSLDLLYLDKAHSAHGLPLLRQTAAAILNYPMGLKSLQMLCVNDSSAALASRLLGDEYRKETRLTTATFFPTLYMPMELH